MTALMSLWTNAEGRRSTGKYFLTEEDLRMWALSFGYARKHYGKVVLCTDKLGKELLSFLPFDQIILSLTRMPPGIERVWTLGKVRAYETMTEPFISIDHDAFIFRKPKEWKADFFVQSPEPFRTDKQSFFSDAYPVAKFLTIPELGFLRSVLNRVEHCPLNTALFGSSNLEAVGKYCQLAFDVATHLKNRGVCNAMGWHAALFVEQYCLAAFIEREGLTYESHFGFDKIRVWPKVRGYTHLLGPAKYNPVYQEKVRVRLEKDFPHLAVRLAPRVRRVAPDLLVNEREAGPMPAAGIVSSDVNHTLLPAGLSDKLQAIP